MSQNEYILVTGGAGYIGSHTVVELIQNGKIPIIVDDFRNADPKILAGIERIVEQPVQCYQLDVCDQKAMRTVFENCICL